MAIPVQVDAAHTFRFRPEAPWTGTPTARVLSRAGVELETPTPSVDAVSTTISAATTRWQATLTSAAGVERGRIYRVTDPTFGVAVVEVASVDGSVVTFTEPLPAVPDSGSAFEGLEVDVAITSTSTGTVGLDFKIEAADGGSTDRLYEVFDVVKFPFLGPVTARQVRARLASHHEGESPLEELVRNMTDEANARLRSLLRAADEYLSRFWDPGQCADAGKLAMRLVLHENGFIERGRDQVAQEEFLRKALAAEVQRLTLGAAKRDRDQDGNVTDDDEDDPGSVREWYR